MSFLKGLLTLTLLLQLTACGGGGAAGSGGNVGNPNLSALAISSGILTPGFSSGNLSYTATVTFITETLTITAFPAASNSVMTINGVVVDSTNSLVVSLDEGINVFDISLDSRGLTKTYQLTITRKSVFEVQSYIKASNAETFDILGLRTAISGETMAVSAFREDSDGSSESDNTVIDSGAVYIYVLNGTQWEQQAYIKASNANDTDIFGISVALSGDTLVVGASLEDSDGSSEGDNSSEATGAVYVFTRSGSTWSQQAYLKASNLEADDRFGKSVAIDGDTLIVGAMNEDGNGSAESDNSMMRAGAAYIFTRNGSIWTQQAYLKASNADADDNFGHVVSINADTVVIGADDEDGNGSNEADNSINNSGAAYVFTRASGVWTQQAYLKASNVGAEDTFSTSVAVDGDVIVVGAKREDSDGSSEADDSASFAGAVYVYSRTGSAWTQQAYLKSSNIDAGDQFGSSVAVEGDLIAVGALSEAGNGTTETDNSADFVGAVYIFTQSGNIWTQQNYIKAFNAEDGDQFGISLDFDNGLLVVGAFGEDSNGNNGRDNSAEDSGAAYIFQ